MSVLPPNIHTGNIFDRDVQEVMQTIKIPNTIQTRFGVELETCIRIDPECIPEFTNVDLDTLIFKDKFDMYFKHILAPFCISNPKFAIKYKIVGVISTATTKFNDFNYNYFIYDLVAPFNTIDGSINFHVASGEEFKMIENYEIPRFLDDCTLQCGDTQGYKINHHNPYNEEIENILQKNMSIGIECVTPILSFKGEANSQKITNELGKMLQFFGVGRKPVKCFIPNYSSGFHVNISLFDTVKNAYYNLSSSKFYAYLLEIFTIYESQYYRHIRTRKPVRANKTVKKNWISTWAQPIYPEYDKARILSDQAFQETLNVNNMPLSLNNQRRARSNIFREKIMAFNMTSGSSLLSGKFRSIMKKNNILEFRLFQSDRDIHKLLDYTLTTANIVQNTLKYYAVLNNLSEIPDVKEFARDSVPARAPVPVDYSNGILPINENMSYMQYNLENQGAGTGPLLEEISNSANSVATSAATGSGFGYVEEINGGHRRRKTLSKKLKKIHRKRHTKRRR